MSNQFQPRSKEIIAIMEEHGMGDPFIIELNPEEREGSDYIRFRQRLKNCADRLSVPRRVSINRKGTDAVVVTLLGEKR